MKPKLEIPVLYGGWFKGDQECEALIVFNPSNKRVSVKGFKIVNGTKLPGPCVTNITYIPQHLKLEVFEKTRTKEVISDELLEWCTKVFNKAPLHNSWFDYGSNE